MIPDYEEKVYTAVLGKIVGVYAGRPIEGWSKNAIMERFGMIDRYVADEAGVPLIVTDDDISGTFTFVRVLADSGLYAETPYKTFGDNWLNYLIENKTVLWWGGMCFSTEHTAYLRLKHGIHAPESGSIARNGRTVAEQIGAQIFIDAFGMVAPGDPALAVQLAEKAAKVSHDGEAVYAAQVVAAMVSEAFVSNDMEHLLDTALSFIPAGSLIAQIHRDIRAWVKEDGDWEKTFDRIREKYGYQKYSGGCHVVPNHAVMVMAWSYAPADFHKAMTIVNTAGWDTDCNAANVGTVSALVCGLDAMRKPYDYLTPFADTVYLPTAEGTFAVMDAANQAYAIAEVGRKIMGWEDAEKRRAFCDFRLRGSCHGFKPGSVNDHGSLLIRGEAGQRVMRELLIPGSEKADSNYKICSTSLFYPGMSVKLKGSADAAFDLVFNVIHEDGTADSIVLPVTAEGDFDLLITPPLSAGDTVTAFGFSFQKTVTLRIREVDFCGNADLYYDNWIPSYAWISSCDGMMNAFNGETRYLHQIRKNEGRGVYVTGNRFWLDCAVSCMFRIHGGESGGLLLRYQGLERYVALVFGREKTQIVKRCYGEETILAETDFALERDVYIPVKFRVEGQKFTAVIGEDLILTAVDGSFTSGGCGCFVESGVAGVRETAISATVSGCTPHH